MWSLLQPAIALRRIVCSHRSPARHISRTLAPLSQAALSYRSLGTSVSVLCDRSPFVECVTQQTPHSDVDHNNALKKRKRPVEASSLHRRGLPSGLIARHVRFNQKRTFAGDLSARALERQSMLHAATYLLGNQPQDIRLRGRCVRVAGGKPTTQSWPSCLRQGLENISTKQWHLKRPIRQLSKPRTTSLSKRSSNSGTILKSKNRRHLFLLRSNASLIGHSGSRRFQTNQHHSGVDVAHGLVLLFGIGTRPFHHGNRRRGGTIYRAALL